ncbi:hypothetical protein [Tautonia plasticadhaerens]|uniref:Uncharacterized protein n=1 Tax=Tautonia plasticadhaerens TaxID=2527974 RepID=A0A518H2D7_9BACT|nr:hypothetical protein [Tautonia plasticadhaerens]QDV35011.1 hypothetical protein ElP_29080 [Tautonia plasticadhaerens]
MHPGLAALFEADRQDHEAPKVAGTPGYAEMRRRDADRRARAAAILRDEGPGAPIDWYHAAWLFHHGDSPEEAEAASRLAARAMDAGHAPARWLHAAATDRGLMSNGLPQRFGTQIVPDGRRYRVWDTDPSTTDEERAALDVPPLAEQHRRADEQTASCPQPPMDLAPAWLKDAIARWEGSGRA